MLSDALTSFKVVRSRLQQHLLKLPEYRALLILDEAALRLGEVLAPTNPQVAGCPQDRIGGAASPVAAVSPEPVEVATDPARNEHRIAIAAAPRTGALDEPARNILSIVREERIANASAPAAAALAAAFPLYGSGGLALDIANRADRVLEAPAPVVLPEEEPIEAALNILFPKDRGADAAPPKAVATQHFVDAAEAPPQASAISGIAALYESFGDAPSVAHPEYRIADAQISGIADADELTSDANAPAPTISRIAALYESISDAPNVAHRQDWSANSPVSPLPVSGMASARYESVGDAPYVANSQARLAQAGADTSRAATAPTDASAATNLIPQPVQTAAPTAKTPTPRSYLPFVAAQRLVQTRRP